MSHPPVTNTLRQPEVPSVTATTARAQAPHGIEVHTQPSHPDPDLWAPTTDNRQDTQNRKTQGWTTTRTPLPWIPPMLNQFPRFTCDPPRPTFPHTTYAMVPFVLHPRSRSHMPPPSRSHVRRARWTIWTVFFASGASHFRTLSLLIGFGYLFCGAISHGVARPGSTAPAGEQRRSPAGQGGQRVLLLFHSRVFQTFVMCGRNAVLPDDQTAGRSPARLVEGMLRRRPRGGWRCRWRGHPPPGTPRWLQRGGASSPQRLLGIE